MADSIDCRKLVGVLRRYSSSYGSGAIKVTMVEMKTPSRDAAQK